MMKEDNKQRNMMIVYNESNVWVLRLTSFVYARKPLYAEQAVKAI